MTGINKRSTAIRLLTEYIRPYSKLLIAALFCMLVAAAATAAFPYFMKPAFDIIAADHSSFGLFLVSVFILAAFFVKGIASYGESFIIMYVGQKMIFDIQQNLFKHLLYMDLQFFVNTPSGDILSRFANDTALMRSAVSNAVVGLGKDLITFIFLACVMFYRDTVLAIFAFIVFPGVMVPVFVIGRKIKKIVQNNQEYIGGFSGYLMQIFQGIKVVRSYCAEKYEIARTKSKIDELIKLSIKTSKAKSALHPISECICGVAIVIIVIYGGHQIMNGSKTIGDLVSFLCAILLCYNPLKKITTLSATIQEGLAAAERIFDILNITPKICNTASSIQINDIEKIEFQNVSFGYYQSKNVLNDISFTVHRGETIAFVGESGSGKSTIINLLNRFYDVDKGAILINGVNIKEINTTSLRSKIALVTQENILFNVSFYENICYGNSEADYDDVVAAAKSALAHDFIIKTNDQYKTIIGENGIKISGGQRQRIAIARAMLKNSQIILLDEATSALDTKSEKIVQEALNKLMLNRTTIVVTHRLSSITSATRIYVVSDGKIVESGTHDQLIELKQIYYRLWQAQLYIKS